MTDNLQDDMKPGDAVRLTKYAHDRGLHRRGRYREGKLIKICRNSNQILVTRDGNKTPSAYARVFWEKVPPERGGVA